MGQKMVRFAQLGAARSRQDKSIEVGKVGSKRPSSGGNGGHVLSLYPLTWRSLGTPAARALGVAVAPAVGAWTPRAHGAREGRVR
jgi:hypothetical protein